MQNTIFSVLIVALFLFTGLAIVIYHIHQELKRDREFKEQYKGLNILGIEDEE